MSGSSNVWIEITKSEHGHGGPGWEYGKCLWSPSRNRGGSDTYNLMRMASPGHRVVHFYRDTWGDGPAETRIAGMSRVRLACRKINSAPPSPGDWADMAPYYRIALTGYEPFSAPIPVQQLLDDYHEEIRRELVDYSPRHYPFALRKADTPAEELRTNQGMYLAACTSTLYLLIQDALSINASDVLAPLSGSAHVEYGEGRRALREQRYFIRNQTLVREAKKHYGFTCQVCGFNFRDVYGQLGEDFIECHHLKPLADRAVAVSDESQTTTLEDVTVLCANCHRMVHRRRPALSIDELRQSLRVK